MLSDTQTIVATDPRLRWAGHVSLETVGHTVRPWRIPYLDRALFPGVADKAEMAAGVRIVLETDAAHVGLDAETVGSDGQPAQAAVGDEVVDLSPGTMTPLPGGGRRTVELWLPHFGTTIVRGVVLPGGASVNRPPDDERPVWLTYGSSITHCRTATAPTRTWPARVARAAGLDLTCLGFGGQCHLDPMVARVIRNQPADLISICCGINIHGSGSLNSRSFPAAVIGTVETIREDHPDTPLCLISPIWGDWREIKATADLTLVDMRRVLAETVATLRDRGDEALHYVDGLTLFGPNSIGDGDLKRLMPDDLHPNDEAQPILADNVLRRVIAGVFGVS